MAETIPADFIDHPATGYFYASLLSEHGQQQVTSLLAKLELELPGVIWPMPAAALHTTLCEIVQSRKEYSEDKDVLFETHRTTYEEVPERILSDLGRFTVCFNVIEASEHAIIIRGSNPSKFNDLRAQFLTSIPFPAETKAPPDIVHSSIARYRKAVDLAHVQEVIGHYSIDFDEPITQFKLLHTHVPPLLDYTVLKTYPL